MAGPCDLGWDLTGVGSVRPLGRGLRRGRVSCGVRELRGWEARAGQGEGLGEAGGTPAPEQHSSLPVGATGGQGRRWLGTRRSSRSRDI